MDLEISWTDSITQWGSEAWLYIKSIVLNLWEQNPPLAIIMVIIISIIVLAIVLYIASKLFNFSLYHVVEHEKEDWENSIVEFNMENYK